MDAINTFWKLLCKYDVKIPMIQRDYAHGRSDEHTQEVRSSLLDNIKSALCKRGDLDFDFVYGSVNGNEMLPLDGQQRLTTLFLLHWYFSVKEQQDISDKLIKFSYATRISARDFCEQLVLQPLRFDEFNGKTVEEIIKNKKWFQFHWSFDPTVESMLVMLNEIDQYFHDFNEPVLDRLMSDHCPITFSFLELERFGLGDELYIKMNSRGKPLSTFENFKAQFEQLLEKSGFIQESKQFSLKIDQQWTDLLWEYRDEDYTIDRAFMRLFTFISSSLYLKEHPYERSSTIFTKDFSKLSDLEKVYSKKENVVFLFDALSLWRSQEEIHQEFKGIFSNVPLFNHSMQLFDKCIDNSLQLDERVLLYTVFVKKIASQVADLGDTLRVIRNLLNRIRQGNNGVFNSNLRVESIGTLLSTVDHLVQLNKPIYEALLELKSLSGFAERSVLQEKEKAELIAKNPHLKEKINELEDLPRLKGAIHLWIDAFIQYPDQLYETLIEIDKLSSALVSRALLSLDNYAIQIGWSNLGPRYLFGGNASNREFLWTNNNDSLKPIFTLFISKVLANNTANSVEEKVSSIIRSNNKWNVDEWPYYFIKYETMLKDHQQVFVLPGNHKAFGIERLSGINLQSAHVNPIYETIINLIGDRDICRKEDCEKRLSERSEIKTSNAIFKLSGTKWTYEVDPNIKTELDQYALTLTNFDIVEQGYALVTKAHELKK